MGNTFEGGTPKSLRISKYSVTLQLLEFPRIVSQSC